MLQTDILITLEGLRTVRLSLQDEAPVCQLSVVGDAPAPVRVVLDAVSIEALLNGLLTARKYQAGRPE